jgi:hypothetical protein
MRMERLPQHLSATPGVIQVAEKPSTKRSDFQCRARAGNHVDEQATIRPSALLSMLDEYIGDNALIETPE